MLSYANHLEALTPRALTETKVETIFLQTGLKKTKAKKKNLIKLEGRRHDTKK